MPHAARPTADAAPSRGGTAAASELGFTPAEVERFWSDVAAREYETANRVLAATHAQRFRIAIPELALPPGGRLLNIWSRQGEAIPHIRARFPDAALVNAELSRVMIRQCRERFPGETVIETDLRSIAAADAVFDTVLSLETLEHSPSPRALLREMRRVLKPGGRLVLTCPAPPAEFHLWVADHLLGNHGEGPHCFHGTRTVKRMLAEAGLALLRHRATLFVPEELGLLSRLDPLAEKLLQWRPACELALRQLYVAQAAPPEECTAGPRRE